MSLITYLLIGTLIGVISNIAWHQYKLNTMRKEHDKIIKSIEEQIERNKKLVAGLDCQTKAILDMIGK